MCRSRGYSEVREKFKSLDQEVGKRQNNCGRRETPWARTVLLSLPRPRTQIRCFSLSHARGGFKTRSHHCCNNRRRARQIAPKRLCSLYRECKVLRHLTRYELHSAYRAIIAGCERAREKKTQQLGRGCKCTLAHTHPDMHAARLSAPRVCPPPPCISCIMGAPWANYTCRVQSALGECC